MTPQLKPLPLLEVLARTGYSLPRLQKLMLQGDFPQKPWTADKVDAWVADRKENKPFPSGAVSLPWRQTKLRPPLPNITTRDYYTAREIKEIAGVIQKTSLNNWIAKGIFPQRIPGQGNRWDKAEVDAWRSDRDKGYPMLYPIVHPPFAQEYLRWQATGQPLEDITYAWLPAKKLAVQWMNGRPRKGATTIDLVQPSQQPEPATVAEISFLEQPTGQSLQQVQAPVPGTCTNCTQPANPGHIHCTTCEFLLKYGHQQKFNDRTVT
jgi:predicted DNA-binding transcriptional regulator AlpA